MAARVFIEKEAKQLPADAFPRVYTRSARAALRHILRARLIADPRGILLPAYIGLSPKEGSASSTRSRRRARPSTSTRSASAWSPISRISSASWRRGDFNWRC